MAALSVELATAYVSLAISTKGLGKDIAKQFGDVDGMAAKTGKSAGARMSGAMGKALKVGAAGVVAAGIGTLGTAMVKGFQRLNALDQATAKLSGLGHSAQTVDAIMQNALASVRGTAFGMDEAATTAAGAVAAGIKPGKELERTLALVADAATIGGASMSEMGAIFNKVATSNKIQGDVINQLNDRGIPIIQLLSKELGVSAEETVKLAAAGKINFETFRNAMESGVGGAAQESGKTFQGAMANVMAALGRIGANLLSGIFPMVTSGLGTIQAALAPLEDAAKVVGEAIGQFLQNALTMWSGVKGVFDEVFGSGPAAEALAGAMVAADAAAKPFAETMAAINEALEGAVMQARLAALRDILTQVKAAYDVAAEGVGVFLQALTGGSEVGEFEGVMGVLNDIGSEVFAKFLEVKDVVGEVLGVIVGAFGPVIAQLGEQFGPILKDLIPQIVGIVQNLSPMSLIFQALKPILPQIVGLIASLVEALGGTLAAIIPTVVDVLGTLGEIFSSTIVPIVTELVSTLLPVFLEIFTAIMPVLAQIARAILPALAQVFSVIVPVIGTLVRALLPPLTKLFAAVAPLIAAVAQVIGKLVEILVPILVPILEVLVKILSAILVPAFKLVGWVIEKIVVPVIGAVVKAITWVAGGFSGLGDTVKKVFDFIGKIFLNFTGPGLIIKHWDTIKGAFSSAWDWIKTVFGVLWNGVKDVVSKPIDLAKAAIDKIFDAATGVRSIFNKVKDWVVTTFKASWDKIQDTISAPVSWARDKITDIIGKIKSAFEGLRDGVSRIFDRLKSLVATPINWIITNVINKLLGGVRKVLDTLGQGGLAKKLKDLPTTGVAAGMQGMAGMIGAARGYATGGVLPGFTPGRDVHAFISPTGGRLLLSGGEGIMRPEFVKMIGGKAGVDLLNAAARKSGGALASAFDALGHMQSFAGGGIVSFKGHRFTALGASRLRLAERLGGGGMQITQGGWRPTTSYSGTSHRGDAVDIAGAGFRRFVVPLRSVGWPAWDRTGKGRWIPHVHAVPLPGHGVAGGSAVWQAQDYLRGGDGLGGRDHHPRPKINLAGSSALAGLSGAQMDALSMSGSATARVSSRDLIMGAVSKFLNVRSPGGGVIGEMAVALPKQIAEAAIKKIDGLLGFQGGGVMPFNGQAALSEDGRPELVVGPQIRNLNRGSRVFNADETERLMGKQEFHFHGDIELHGVEDLDEFRRQIKGFALAKHHAGTGR